MEDGIVIAQERIEAVHALLEKVKEAYRKDLPGCCRVFSLGDGCRCVLCLCDEVHGLIGAAHRSIER
jgi:hypothetical protein